MRNKEIWEGVTEEYSYFGNLAGAFVVGGFAGFFGATIAQMLGSADDQFMIVFFSGGLGGLSLSAVWINSIRGKIYGYREHIARLEAAHQKELQSLGYDT